MLELDVCDSVSLGDILAAVVLGNVNQLLASFKVVTAWSLRC